MIFLIPASLASGQAEHGWLLLVGSLLKREKTAKVEAGLHGFNDCSNVVLIYMWLPRLVRVL